MKVAYKDLVKEINAIKVRQWLPEWEKVAFEPQENRRRPEDYFYLFSMAASHLKALCGIYRRITKAGEKRSSDLGIQRRHEPECSSEIHEYVKYGFPWSNLSAAKRKSGEYDDLRKPGWLPTAIVINILRSNDKRNGVGVDKKDLITVEDTKNAQIVIKLPDHFSGPDWKPVQIPPAEIIDG